MALPTLLCGPCKLVFGAATFYSQGDVQIKLVEDRYKIKVAGFRDLQERTKNRRYEISFTPAGEFRNLSVMWPYASSAIGTKVFANNALTIWSKDATYNKRIYSNAAITKLPGIAAGTGGTILGSVTFTCIIKDGAVPGDSDAYVVQSTDTYPTEALDVSTILTPVFARSWGASPFDVLYVNESGVVFDFPINFFNHDIDGLGTVNMSITGHEAMAKFTPMGLTEMAVRTAVGSNSVFGAAPTVNDLIVAGTGVHLTLYSSQLRDENMAFGSGVNRIGEITAMATQTFSAGAANPIYRIAAAAP